MRGSSTCWRWGRSGAVSPPAAWPPRGAPAVLARPVHAGRRWIFLLRRLLPPSEGSPQTVLTLPGGALSPADPMNWSKRGRQRARENHAARGETPVLLFRGAAPDRRVATASDGHNPTSLSRKHPPPRSPSPGAKARQSTESDNSSGRRRVETKKPWGCHKNPSPGRASFPSTRCRQGPKGEVMVKEKTYNASPGASRVFFLIFYLISIS